MSRRRAAIFISGRGSNMDALLDAMADADHPAEAALVLSNNPDAAGLARAEARGVPVAAMDHRAFKGDRPGFEAALSETLAAHRIDLILLAGFMRLLTADFVEAWRDRMLNIHPSLLPSFKGLDTHQRALELGVALHGCTVHLVRPEMDDGPILGQAALRVGGSDEAELSGRVLALEHRLYPAALTAWVRGDLRMENGRIRPAPIALLEGG